VSNSSDIEKIDRRLRELECEKEELLSQKTALQNIGYTLERQFKLSSDEKIALFKSYFRGRSELFARYWKNKQGKSGYSPVCNNEWVRKLCNKPKIKCSECPNQSFPPLTDKELYFHLTGKQIVGLYPLDQDNNCYFLAFDFDKADWKKAIKALGSICESYSIPHIIEISKSGNGAHLWIFFGERISATNVRKFGFRLLDLTMEIYPGLSFESYDRIFPNQDMLPTNGFGNLIALPLQYEARQTGGSIFVDQNLNIYDNQWLALSNTKKLALSEFSEIVTVIHDSLQKLSKNIIPWERHLKPNIDSDSSLQIEQKIILANRIYFELEKLPAKIATEIKRIASFSNPEFFKKQSMRFSTLGTPRYISCASIEQNYLSIPRGCLDEVIDLFISAKISYRMDDKRQTGQLINKLKFLGQLRPNQIKAVDTLLKHDNGILHASTAFGKTIAAIAIIANRKTKTLILVHNKILLNQWAERLHVFLEGIEIGIIGGGKSCPSLQIDVGTYQSLIDKKSNTIKSLVHDYGQIIIDECHHLSAPNYEFVVNEVHAKYVLGLTATPNRRDGHQKIMAMQAGPVRCKVQTQTDKSFQQILNRIEISHRPPSELTDTENRPHISQVYNWLTNSEKRNQQIVCDVNAEIKNGACCIVLTERRNHANILHQLLTDQNIKSVLLHGGLKKENKNIADETMNIAQAIVATGKYIGEGFDFDKLDTLFLALPISWSGLLSQYVGRIHRSHQNKQVIKVYDYVDTQLPMLERMYKKRAKGYKALGYAFPLYSPLFDSDQNQRELNS